MLRSWRQATSVSTPSATTWMFIWWARWMAERTIDPILFVVQAADQGAVKFELVDGEPLQLPQGEVAGSEVIDGDGGAELVQLSEQLRRHLGGRKEAVLCDLEFEGVAGEAGGSDRAGDERGQVPVGRDGTEREIQGKLQPQSGPPPVAGRAGRVLDHALGQGALVAAADDQVEERIRRDHPQVRMNPAGQRLDPDHMRVAKIDLRQEVGLNFAHVESASDIPVSTLAGPVLSVIGGHTGSPAPLSPPRESRVNRL